MDSSWRRSCILSRSAARFLAAFSAFTARPLAAAIFLSKLSVGPFVCSLLTFGHTNEHVVLFIGSVGCLCQLFRISLSL
jgi:hypothetical protein